MAYMWRDIERRARMYGFEPQLPAPYRYAEFDLPNRIAIVAASEGLVRRLCSRVLALAKSEETDESYRKTQRKRTHSECRRPSSSSAKHFGVTTASKMRFAGASHRFIDATQH